jgi:hypothetical protein
MTTTQIVMTPQKRWLRPDDFEAEFAIKKDTQAQLRKDRKIPYSKRGNFVYYDRDKINQWLEDAAMVV